MQVGLVMFTRHTAWAQQSLYASMRLSPSLMMQAWMMQACKPGTVPVLQAGRLCRAFFLTSFEPCRAISSFLTEFTNYGNN